MKRKIFIGFLVVLAIALIVFIIFLLTRPEEMKDIKYYEKQTHQYYDKKGFADNTFLIDSEKEYNIFKKQYDTPIDEKVNFEKDLLFIQVKPASSGSIMMKLKKVVIKKDQIVFQIKEKTPKKVTDDIAFWYFVAVIPRDKAAQYDLSNWHKISKVKK